jgi:hypothetical protein
MECLDGNRGCGELPRCARKHAEHGFKSAGEDSVRPAARMDHRFPGTLGYRCRRQNDIATGRAEKEVCPVIDLSLDQRRRSRGVGRVVERLQVSRQRSPRRPIRLSGSGGGDIAIVQVQACFGGSPVSGTDPPNASGFRTWARAERMAGVASAAAQGNVSPVHSLPLIGSSSAQAARIVPPDSVFERMWRAVGGLP